jgi:hypothetical protein
MNIERNSCYVTYSRVAESLMCHHHLYRKSLQLNLDLRQSRPALLHRTSVNYIKFNVTIIHIYIIKI